MTANRPSLQVVHCAATGIIRLPADMPDRPRSAQGGNETGPDQFRVDCVRSATGVGWHPTRPRPVACCWPDVRRRRGPCLLHLPEHFERFDRRANVRDSAERISQPFHFKQLIDRDRTVFRSSRGRCHDGRSAPARFPLAVLEAVGKPDLDFHSRRCQPGNYLFRRCCRIRHDVVANRFRFLASLQPRHDVYPDCGLLIRSNHRTPAFPQRQAPLLLGLRVDFASQRLAPIYKLIQN